jgi:RNA polymerase sigma factor (sigma-70 family)
LRRTADAYLRAAIVRAHLSWRRRLASTEKVTAEPRNTDAASPDFAQRLAVRDELWSLLATLSRTQRTVLVLRYYEDLDDHRIAEVLGCAPATVRTHISRARNALRARLSREVTQPQGNSR